MLKPKGSPQPSDSTWNLMWRHVYDLGSTGIEWDGFSGKIALSTGDRTETFQIKPNDVRSFVNIFGLDHSGIAGDPNPDDQIDRIFINTALGELEFPSLRPFAPDSNDIWYIGPDETLPQYNPLLEFSGNDTLYNPEIYDEAVSSARRANNPLNIVVEYSNISATYELGWMVLEGSEEVILNGQRLNRGIDYTIDYMSGSLTILKREALSPDAKLEIKYETGQLMQLDTKTMLGIRAQYELWDNSYIGTTLMYRSEKTMDQRIRIGSEPLRNSIWDVNVALKFEPEFLTRAVDWLPLISTNKPSSFTIDGEVAQVYPNPNSYNSPSTGDNNGVAYVDDFESIKRSVPLGVTRKLWSAASYPDYDSRGPGTWLQQRGRLIWCNPYQQVKITDIWPEREVQAEASKTNVLQMDFQPWWNEWGVREQWGGEIINTRQSWGGVMRYLGAGFADQTESKYIEIWLKRVSGTGVIYVDLGHISEDVIPNNVLDTEDKPLPDFPFGNGILDGADEDTGIDGIAAKDPADSVNINGLRDVNNNDILLPSFDDYAYSRGNLNDYSHINGSENNRGDEGGHYPDTEDLDGDTQLDNLNSYYRYKIDLSEGDNNKYIAGGKENPKGWRLYRIPMADTVIVGNPSFASIEYVRIWITDSPEPASIKIAQFEIVGNEWQEVLAGSKDKQYEPVSVAVINTHDNPEYEPPPGVSGELDPVTGLRAKEQSLVVRVNKLGTGDIGRIRKQSRRAIDLLDYRYLKMFVHGGDYRGQLVDRFQRELDLEMFIRLGPDIERNKYYEYSQRLNPGWSEQNEIIIDLERLSAIKFLRERDSLRNYDILPNGDVMRVVGDPSIGDIKDFEIGIKNHGREISEADGVEFWVDEMRVSDVHRDPGWAARGAMSLEVADLLSISANLSQQDAHFHSVDSRKSPTSNREKLEGGITAKLNLGKFFNPQWGIKLSLNSQFNQNIYVPKYKPGSDIKLSSLGGKQVNIYSIFRNSLFNNDRMSDNQMYESPSDSLIDIRKRYSINSSFSKSAKSSNPFVKYTLEKTSLSFNHSEDYSSDYRNLYKKSRKNSGSIKYNFSFDEPLEINWLSWTRSIPLLGKLADSKLQPLPRTFSVSVDGSETYETSKSRSGHVPRPKDPLDVGRSYRVSWQPVGMLNLSFDQNISADRVRSDSLRSAIARWHVEIDTSEYFIIDPEDSSMTLDSAAFNAAVENEAARIKNELFWKLLGEYLVDNRLSQNFSMSLTPRLVNWLTTDFNYRAGYNWTWGNAFGPSDRSVRVDGSFASSMSLGLQQILSRFIQGGDKDKSKQKDKLKGESDGYDPFDGKDPYKSGSDFDPYGKGFSEPEKDFFKPDEMDSKPFGDVSEPGDGIPEPGEGEDKKENASFPPGLKPGGNEAEKAAPDSTVAEKAAPDSTIEEKKEPIDYLKPLREILRRLRDIRWQYTLSNDARHSPVERGQASWAYRLGFDRDPGLQPVKDYIFNEAYGTREEHTLTSGLEITRTIRLSSLSYNFSSSKNSSQSEREQGTNTQTIWYYFGEGTDIKSFPIVNWSASWSGLGELELVQKVANSVSVDNSFRGSETKQWQGFKDSTRQTTRIEYDKGFSPLIGLSITWRGGIGSNARYNFTQRVTDDRTGRGTKNRTITESIDVSANYTARKGIKIPVWPFKKMKNSTSFAFAYRYSKDKNETSASAGKDEGSTSTGTFTTLSKSSSWSITPSMEYSFSNAVKGGFSYEYGVRKSDRAPNVKSQEFSFRVNISIRG